MNDRSTDNLSSTRLSRKVQRFRLVVLEGADAGKDVVSQGDRIVVGAHPTAELALTDRSVSRFHCEVRIENERAILRDLESLNGTTVDSVPVLEAPLRPNAVIQVGRASVRFQLDDSANEVPMSPRSQFGALLGRSERMRQAFAVLETAARSESTVLLGGETGTGKELAARALHQESARKDGPFVVIDCGAIPRELMESELFGHERGAFTDAGEARIGAFEAANGGTIFLDEIGELPLELQPKLLRVLEARECRRIGSNKTIRVDVRVVAATHRDLRKRVNTRAFRSDLYYRIAVVELALPPLRDRREDLPMLVQHLLVGLGAHDQAERLAHDADFHADLARYSWPGNVRELRNYLERCAALHERVPLGAAPPEPAKALRTARDEWMKRFEAEYLADLLARNSDNVAAAARAAKVDRAYLYRLLWRNGLR